MARKFFKEIRRYKWQAKLQYCILYCMILPGDSFVSCHVPGQNRTKKAAMVSVQYNELYMYLCTYLIGLNFSSLRAFFHTEVLQ